MDDISFISVGNYPEAIFRPSSCITCSSLVFCHYGGCGPRDSSRMASDGPGGGEGHAIDSAWTVVYAALNVRQCRSSVWKVISLL